MLILIPKLYTFTYFSSTTGLDRTFSKILMLKIILSCFLNLVSKFKVVSVVSFLIEWGPPNVG